MSRTLRVLIVEDSEEDTLLLVRELRRYGYDPTFLRVDRPESMKNALNKQKWDIVISDYSMPQFDGLSALSLLKESELDLPFIIVSGTIGEDVAVAAMKAGAHDYIMKGNLARLVPAVERELREAEIRRARKQAEEQLRQSERLRTVGELAASIIHDFKNPIQVVLGTTELLDAEGVSAERRVKGRRTIDKQVQRMLAMTQDILDFARGEMNFSPTTVNLPEFCQELVDSHKQTWTEGNIRLSYTQVMQSGSSPTLLLDREKIWRVMTNLMGNAKEAMPEGGEIRLHLQIRPQEAQLDVQDTGQGISKEIRDRLFQPFVTYGKSRGTGLGLSIVKRIVEAHGGVIAFTTTEGTGTTFSLTLPRQMPRKNEYTSEGDIQLKSKVPNVT